MIFVLASAGLMIVIALALASAGPATQGSRSRAVTRRAAFVRTHPRHANSGDVLNALAREGVDVHQARSTMDAAATRGIPLTTLWQWIDRHGDAALAMVSETERPASPARPAARSVAEPLPVEVRAESAAYPATAASQDDFLDTEDWPEPEGSTRARVSLSDNVSRDGGRRSAA